MSNLDNQKLWYQNMAWTPRDLVLETHDNFSPGIKLRCLLPCSLDGWFGFTPNLIMIRNVPFNWFGFTPNFRIVRNDSFCEDRRLKDGMNNFPSSCQIEFRKIQRKRVTLFSQKLISILSCLSVYWLSRRFYRLQTLGTNTEFVGLKL